MRYITNFIFSLLFIALFIPGTAFAALDLINIKTIPKTPGENQDVTISLEAYAVDLNSAKIIWYVDKDPRKEGIAEKKLTIHTGELGQKTVVDITILTETGVKIDKQIIIVPAEIDLLWEAQTYTPPFYKGKALPSFKSLIRVTAIPRWNKRESDPTKFTYKWTYNRTQNISGGLGKNSVVIPAGWPDSQVPIAVETSLSEAAWTGYSNTSIPTANPKLVFYEQAPLLGIQFDHALSSAQKNVLGNEFAVHAVPYFFSTDNYFNNELVYTWKINNNNIAVGMDPMNLTIPKQGKGAESYNIGLRIQSPKRILQEGNAQTGISFSAE
jgi:hypothetical protein